MNVAKTFGQAVVVTRHNILPVDHFVCCSLVKCIVEPEVLVVEILGQINLGFWLVNDDLIFVGASYHVHLLFLVLFLQISFTIT